MTLSRIKLANKKYKHRKRRDIKHADFVQKSGVMKIRNRRMRKMMIEGRREQLKKRREELKYVGDLENEVKAKS